MECCNAKTKLTLYYMRPVRTEGPSGNRIGWGSDMAFEKDASVEVERRAEAADSIEHRVVTPRSDLVVVRLGKSRSDAALRETEKSAALIDGIARAIRKPGISREVVFKGRRSQRVYAYSVSPEDVTKIVREDSRGRKTIGHLVHGEFKALRSKTL